MISGKILKSEKILSKKKKEQQLSQLLFLIYIFQNNLFFI